MDHLLLHSATATAGLASGTYFQGLFDGYASIFWTPEPSQHSSKKQLTPLKGELLQL